MRVVFMGTPDFAVGTLKALIEAGHDVAAVVTQPDKPKGRGKELLMTPVKAEAVKAGIPVYQPEKIRKNEEFLSELKKINPDVIVVVAFGQLLPVSVLELPKYGCVNVHASLLPMYRGAAPLQWVIINGEKVSVSSFLLDEEDPPKLPAFYAQDMPAPEHFMHNTLELEERLLAVTKKSAVEIAEYLGYSSQSYFVKVFKKIHGVTPGEFRKG